MARARRVLLLAILAAANAAATLSAQTIASSPPATIDVDERRTDPVAHRYVHGVFPDDARFQLAFPETWNGSLVVFSRGFSGTELTTGAWKTTALDLTGTLTRPLIVMHGTADVIVSPGEAAGYASLVRRRIGRREAERLLATYYIPGMGHGGPEFDPLIGAQLDALESWIEFHESRGRRGAPPPTLLGGVRRERYR